MDNIINFYDETPKFNNMFGFLKFIKPQLEDDDYRDVLCGILDPDICAELEDDLKQIVMSFLNRCTFVQDFT